MTAEEKRQQMCNNLCRLRSLPWHFSLSLPAIKVNHDGALFAPVPRRKFIWELASTSQMSAALKINFNGGALSENIFGGVFRRVIAGKGAFVSFSAHLMAIEGLVAICGIAPVPKGH